MWWIKGGVGGRRIRKIAVRRKTERSEEKGSGGSVEVKKTTEKESGKGQRKRRIRKYTDNITSKETKKRRKCK